MSDMRHNFPRKLGGAPERSEGEVVPMTKRFGSRTTPSEPFSDASRNFLGGAATPPNLGGELCTPPDHFGQFIENCLNTSRESQ